MHRALALILTLGLAACVSPGGDDAAPPGAIAGDAIATTALPAPAATDATSAADTSDASAADAVAEDAGAAAIEDPLTEAPVNAPADVPAGEDPAAPAESPAEEPAATEIPAPRSEAQIACERRDGTWSRVFPGSEARACVFRTRDNGRRCDAGTDCQGECLARSGTCAPVTPLFGCHEILDDTGRRMTQCIE